MPWQPLPQIAFAVATYPFQASSPADLPLELGDELYIIEQGGKNGGWYRGYLNAPPSLLAGLTSVKGASLQARFFSGIFPSSCVEVREVLGEGDDEDGEGLEDSNGVAGVNGNANGLVTPAADEGSTNSLDKIAKKLAKDDKSKKGRSKRRDLRNGAPQTLSVVAKRDPTQPKPPAPVPMLKIGDETPTSAEEPLVDEIASCLREWHSTNLHDLLLTRQYPLLDKMGTLVRRVDMSRRQFLHNVLTVRELQRLREKTVWDLVKGNKLLSGEVVVRDPAERGRVLTGEDSAFEITKLQSMMSLLDERPQTLVENLALHHLLVDLKSFVGAPTDSTILVFYLATKSSGAPARALTESYITDMPSNGALTSLGRTGQMRTLFTDLMSTDIGESTAVDDELYLVVKVRQSQQALSSKRIGSRSGTATRDDGASSIEKPGSSSGPKSTRRSLMWGKTTQRGYSRGASTAKGPGTSWSDKPGSHDKPPSTAGSIGAADFGKSPVQSQTVNRTVGVGAVKLSAIMKRGDETEHIMPIWSPMLTFAEKEQDEENGWDNVIRDLMDSRTGRFEKSRKAERLHFHLHPFTNPDAEALIKSTPTLLSEVKTTSKMGFSGAPTKPRSDIYITVDQVYLPRHALLSRSTGSAAPVSSNLGGQNLQLIIEVRKANGERIESCIFHSSNGEATDYWESTAAERGESWSQTLKLVIPPTEVAGAHVVMFVSDVPNQPFAIAHMPLWDQQAFMRDGHHSLLLYRYDDTTSLSKENAGGKGGYLNLPWNARSSDEVSKDQDLNSPLATLRLQTYLCSTRFSQDKVLLRLLRWRDQPAEDVRELVKQLVFVPEIEIVKLLNEVFDAIFSILVEKSGDDELEDLSFNALVTVLGIVHDRRFNLGPLVDQYADHKFNYPFATPCLVRSFTRLLANPSDPETSRKLRATFKVVNHILKFITHARGQQKLKEAGIGITGSTAGFSRLLRGIFKALDAMMRNTAPILVGSQTLAVQHFHTWLPELTGLLTTEEILHIAIDFMDSCALVKGRLILYKLILIINYARLDLFSLPDQQSALAANTVRWIAPHWGKIPQVTDQYRDQVRLCCSILATQIDMLGAEVPNHIPKIIDSYLAINAVPRSPKQKLSLLFPTTYPFPSKPISEQHAFDEALIELSSTLSAVSTLPSGMQLELAETEMATLLDDTLRVHLSILHCEAFPASWLSVHIYHHKSTMSTLQYLADILLESFLPHPDDAGLSYNTELWKMFFTTLLKLVGSDALALETFPEQKRRAVWKIAGDVREDGAELLRRTWEAIGWETSQEEQERYGLSKMGGYQVQYVPALVGPIVELCLSVHEGLRKVAVEVLQTMIASEWNMSEDLAIIQTEMIDCLDRLFKSKPLTESIVQKLFVMELVALFEPLAAIPNDPLYLALHEMISTIDEFLDLLVAVHSGDSAGEASNLIHRLRLMEFLRDMQKEEIFIRYVHQLANLQGGARNFTEAGLALRLHADLYEWNPTKQLPAFSDPDFPAQSHFDRKERIYFEMIKYLEDGEAWSSALDAYKVLQTQYESNVYDFSKLARTQRAIATIYQTIAKSDKLIPKYFRVSYRGLGFPPNLREKDFLFEGSPTEKSTAFTDRMQEAHPSAKITSGDIDDVEGQFLQITSLSPHRDLDHHVFQRAKVPNVVRDYLLSSHPSQFSTTVRRNITGPVSSHWVEKMVYVTQDSFPTILQRSEIVGVDRIRLTAEETALERILRKTQEMIAVEKKVLDGEEDMGSLLVEALIISVSPTSDSSVARYRDLIPTSAPLPENSAEDEEVEKVEIVLSPMQNAIKVALLDHSIMIKRCLAMFTKSENAMLRNCCEELSSNFEVTFAPELAVLTSPIRQASPIPIPVWAQSTSPVPTPTSYPSHSHGNSTQAGSVYQNGPRLASSQTNGTIQTTDTSILDTPSHHPSKSERKRLSTFGARAMSAGTGIMRLGRTPSDASNAGMNGANGVNGTHEHNGNTNDGLEVPRPSESDSRSTQSRDRSRDSSAANSIRRSVFGGGGKQDYTRMNGSSHGHPNGRSDNNIGNDTEWSTDVSETTPVRDHASRRDQYQAQAQNQSQGGAGWRRDKTSDTFANTNSSAHGNPMANGGGEKLVKSITNSTSSNSLRGAGTTPSKQGGMGRLGKRLSMLGLGKKATIASGHIGGVIEE